MAKKKAGKKRSKLNNHLQTAADLGKHANFIGQLANDYLSLKEEIDRDVALIREKIVACQPLQLLNFLSLISFNTILNKPTEASYSMEEILTLRAIEYVQSVLVTTENRFCSGQTQEDASMLYMEVLERVKDLYAKTNKFLLHWTAYHKDKHPDFDPVMTGYIVEAQVMSMVRGDRYSVYEEEHLRELLIPHDEVMLELFQTSAAEFIEGLAKLQAALSTARADAVNSFTHLMEQHIFSRFENNEQSNESGEELQVLLEQMMGTSLNNVSEVTGWNEALINSLSYTLNGCAGFFDANEFSGWPIRDLPIQKKPFIIIDGIAYCFDYYSLFDNIYRVIQKTVRALKPEYEATWSNVQQDTSERMVEDLFRKLLPGCVIYRGNYYPKCGSLKERAENDLLVVFEGVLFVVEVKAGSFTYTPPLTDYEAHIASFRSLVEKADNQCDRTVSYIQDREEAPIYDSQNQIKVVLRKDDLERTYKFCVTVDNFNEFASKAEKLSFLRLSNGTVSISIDDLRVYSDYFTSPLCFLHFVEQRTRATLVPSIALHDELDHLGMYIQHNIYSITAAEMGEATSIVWTGYREELDSYFSGLYNDASVKVKPEQPIPSRMKEVIALLDRSSGMPGRLHLCSFLLDLSGESREQLASAIDSILVEQDKTGKMRSVMATGKAKYSLFIHQPGVEELEAGRISDRTYAMMLRNEEQERLRIDLYYGGNFDLERLEFERCLAKDIPPDRMDGLIQLGEQIAHDRVESYIKRTGARTIGRNDRCPCGSGKKYKKCCGR